MAETNGTPRINGETMKRLRGKKNAGTLRCDTCFFYEKETETRVLDDGLVSEGNGWCHVKSPGDKVTIAKSWCAEHRLADYGTSRS